MTEPSVCGSLISNYFDHFFLFVYEISREPLNGFVPKSYGRIVWSLAWTSLKVKVTGVKNGIFPPFLQPDCGLFGKTSLASSFCCF